MTKIDLLYQNENYREFSGFEITLLSLEDSRLRGNDEIIFSRNFCLEEISGFFYTLSNIFTHNMSKLSEAQLCTLSAFSKSARRSILQMVANAQSGHPGGALSTIDFLVLVYSQIIAETGEDVIVSNGHISPAVYASLAEMGYINREEVVENFRKFGSKFEGHITRHVNGIPFGTGPLGSGISAAAGFAVAEKKENSGKRVFCTIGDGEAQEGQVYETLMFAAKEKLNNFIVFVDWNRVQLTASLDEIMPTNLPKIFDACGWNVINVDGHDYQEMWEAIESTSAQNEKPTVLIGKTVMGQGAQFMQEVGEKLNPAWHGKAPSQELVDESLANELALSTKEIMVLEEFRKNEVSWKPEQNVFNALTQKNPEISTGENILYPADKLTDCRSAYGQALLSLAKENQKILALTADVGGSVMTKFVEAELPAQHLQMGIAEQNMVSVSGGLSVNGFVPFCSTFGAFMSSRAKDQARLNDINSCNVKMVATHCGLSVGEDGPTHQAIDDMGSFLGMFNTGICEPADPNHCDRMIRYVASHFGNFYVRMGRHKIPVLTKEDGTEFFGADYQYEYGKCELYRKSEISGITIVATGATVCEAEKARAEFSEPEQVEIIIASSPKQFDKALKSSLLKNKKVITTEDHNPYSGLYAGVCRFAQEEKISGVEIVSCSVTKYQLSGKSPELYAAGGIDSKAILEKLNSF